MSFVHPGSPLGTLILQKAGADRIPSPLGSSEGHHSPLFAFHRAYLVGLKGPRIDCEEDTLCGKKVAEREHPIDYLI